MFLKFLSKTEWTRGELVESCRGRTRWGQQEPSEGTLDGERTAQKAPFTQALPADEISSAQLRKTSCLRATNQAKRQWGSIRKCHLKGLKKKSHLIMGFTASLRRIQWSSKIKRQQFSKTHLLHENSLGVVCEKSSSQMMASSALGNHVNTGW